VIANHSSEMAFSHVRKAFVQSGETCQDMSTDFIQQVQVQCVKTSVARKLSYQSTKIPVLLAMAQKSSRFEHFEKSVDDCVHYRAKNKNTRAKTTRDF